MSPGKFHIRHPNDSPLTTSVPVCDANPDTVLLYPQQMKRLVNRVLQRIKITPIIRFENYVVPSKHHGTEKTECRVSFIATLLRPSLSVVTIIYYCLSLISTGQQNSIKIWKVSLAAVNWRSFWRHKRDKGWGYDTTKWYMRTKIGNSVDT